MSVSITVFWSQQYGVKKVFRLTGGEKNFSLIK